MNNIRTTSLSLKWNNEISESFFPTRGLRQGDPLSPYLFVHCMDKLALLIQEEVQDNSWQPIHVTRGGPKVCHIFFVDNFLLFVKAKSSQVKLVKQVLEMFGYVSSLKVNLKKSKFYCSKNVPDAKVNKFKEIQVLSLWEE